MVGGPGPGDPIFTWKIERKGPRNWDQFLKIGLPEAGPLGGAPKLDLFLKIGLPKAGPLGLAQNWNQCLKKIGAAPRGPPSGKPILRNRFNFGLGRGVLPSASQFSKIGPILG